MAYPLRFFVALGLALSVASISACGNSADSPSVGASGGMPSSGGSLPTGGENGSGSGAAPSAAGGDQNSGGSGAGGWGTGGAVGAGGASSATGGSLGSGGMPFATGGQGSGNPIDCSISETAERSSVIASVVAVTLETDLPEVTGGFIEFGADESYGLVAPLHINAEAFRTLLLGMPFDTEFHYRVHLTSAGGTCTGEDQSMATGSAPAGVPTVQPSFALPDLVTPGFIVVGIGAWATIWNHLGELVWAYEVAFQGVTRALFTYDAQYLIARDGNPSGQVGQGNIRKISLDGLLDEAIELDRSHHDVSATPDNGLLFLVNSEDNCGKIVKMDADGTFSDVFTVTLAFDSLEGNGNDLCHMNSLHYHEFDDSISFSVLNTNAYVKISAQGELQWVLGGGTSSDFSGDSTWSRQHGHMMMDENHLIYFNNRNNNQSALIVEVELDGSTATNIREYDGGGGSRTLGDVQKLPHGNILVTYCNDGLQREITDDERTVREFQWPMGVGYATHRPTLYGPPPER